MATKLKPELKYVILKGLLSEIDVCLYHLPHLQAELKRTKYGDESDEEEEEEGNPNAHIVSKKVAEHKQDPLIVNHLISKYCESLGDMPLGTISHFL